MKFLSAILSFVVLSLSFHAGNDFAILINEVNQQADYGSCCAHDNCCHHPSNSNAHNQQNDNNHKHDHNNCSAFCFCGCCHTFVVIPELTSITTTQDISTNQILYSNHYSFEYSSPIWHPPCFS